MYKRKLKLADICLQTCFLLSPGKDSARGRSKFKFFFLDEKQPRIVHEFFIRERKPAQPVVLH
jgi:hypothetical protein